MKTCTRCGERKELEEFHRDKREKDGRRARCTVCIRGYKAARWQDPAVRERAREYSMNWRSENAERHRENSSRWLEENRERHRENSSRWRTENREQVYAHNAAYRARKRGLPSDGSGPSDWLARMEEDDTWNCHLCGGGFAITDETHHDHRDPISTGTAGTVLANMSLAHSVCNLSRGNTPLSEWAERVGLPDGVV